MAFLVSPGVQVNEIDLTNVVPATSASIGAIAGSFQWGPADQVVTVGSEKQLVETFGQPNDDTYNTVLTAAQFLSYGDTLRVVRAVGSAALNASSDQAGYLIKNKADAENSASPSEVVAKYPGVIGNNIGIEICVADAVAFTGWKFKDQFNGAPGTSEGAAAVGGVNDEMHVVVYDQTGLITGTVDTVLETYAYVSQSADAKQADGTSNYYVDLITKESNWVYMIGTSDVLSNAGDPLTATFDTTIEGTTDNIIDLHLGGGVDDNGITVGQLQSAYDMFEDAETVEISLLMNGNVMTGTDATTIANHIIAIADQRKDCVAFVSPEIATTVNNSTVTTDLITWRSGLTSSSYAFADSGALYVYDKYNDKYRWIAASGSMAGLAANADNVADAWFSPAGFSSGSGRNVTKLA